ncbi:winged helix-turn-helix domain-containing protein [Chloroflexi bacterium TSY]|nr:winged helix-turn-helix domain-containing protein [Chloroflexi bacterium TSY]
MTNKYTEHHIDFRQEIANPLFQIIRGGESGVICGVATLGKSRFLQFLLRQDIHHHYLQEDASNTLFVWADSNRAREISEWALYELLLTALVEVASELPQAHGERNRLLALRREAIIEQNGLLAQRNFEFATRILCHEQKLKLVFILDEFDEFYQKLSRQTLANLRAVRDANKYSVCYILFMRDHPIALRQPDESLEGFYELISRSILYLKPYTEIDTREAIRLISARRNLSTDLLYKNAEDEIVRLSGGHPGLIAALLNALITSKPKDESLETWATNQENVHEEFRKIWQGLRPDEQQTLVHLAQRMTTKVRNRKSLELKGMIQVSGREIQFFTPLFPHYILNQATLDDEALRVDAEAGIVWVNGRQSEQLTSKEFDLMLLLHESLNEIRTHQQILDGLYPGDEGYGINENAIAALVGRVRKKIEPNAKRPRYLLNIKGRGYKLVDRPESG